MEQENTTNPDAGATPTDAPVGNVERTEDQMLADILQRSDFLSDADKALPTEHIDVPNPEGAPEDDDPNAPEVEVSEEANQSEEEATAADDPSTLPADVYNLDDFDEFKVNVKIDGVDTPVSIQDLVKGYATDQHLSQKGRELGDARKALDEERSTKLNEIDTVVSSANTILQNAENAHSREYHRLDAEVKKAQSEGDDYEARELSEKRANSQAKYWAAKTEREGMLSTAESQKGEVQQAEWNKQLEHFNDNVSIVIPDWSESVAGDIRDFALGKGIPEAVINTMTDVNVIKFVDDYRRSETARTRGSVKREKATAKAPPLKSNAPSTTKATQFNAQKRDAVLSGQGSKSDNDSFLKNLASRHFNN